MVSQFAQNEQSLNAVERILVYTQLPPEGDATRSDDPPPSWPERGVVRFTNAAMAYRAGLPLVLKGVSFEIQPGEKVSSVCETQIIVIDRFPARSESLVAQELGKAPSCRRSFGEWWFLFKIHSCLTYISRSVAELQSGQIDIDGKNIRDIGLDTLRHRLALVPQDSTLFLGTLRENMYVRLNGAF